tara:strand:- start:306 stop:539 length:234 start_codon:yes stop_codon:yes gene_type:complete
MDYIVLSPEDIKERATSKAFAKIAMLAIEISDNKMDIVTGDYGPINYEQMILILESNKIELKVWEYITELIEKENIN